MDIEKACPTWDNRRMAAVAICHLSKIFSGGIPAVDDLCLEVEDHELLVLMGPSGCGKTTTLRLIAGLEQPSAGQIVIAGRVADRMPPRDRDVAMVFQQGALYPHLSVRDNLGFGLSLRHIPKSQIRHRVEETAAALGIAELLQRRPGQLSYGQQQRVALGRAIIRCPKLFLLDEPLSSLDAVLRRQLRQEIRSLHERLAAPMIYVTHDASEAMALGQRIAILRQGRLQQVAAPQELYDRPANRFVASLLGGLGMNFFDGRVERADGRLVFLLAKDMAAPIPESHRAKLEPYAGYLLTLGVRPEHMRLTVETGTQSSVLSAQHSITIPAMIDAVERLGDESHVYLKTGDHRFVARTPSDVRAAAGDDVFVSVLPEHLHFFDSTSETTFGTHIGK